MAAVFACIVQAKVIEFSVADHKLHRAQKDEELLQELLALSLQSTATEQQADTATPTSSQPNQQQQPSHQPQQQRQQQVTEGISNGTELPKEGSQHSQAAAAGDVAGACEVVLQAGGGCRVLRRGSGTSVASVGTAVCVFEGKLSNAVPLAEAYAPVPEEEEGGDAGGSQGTGVLVSAAELVCHMYTKVGEDLLGLLRGTFTFVLYESKTGRVLAARDGCGVCPLFQSRTRQGSLALSNSRQLLEGLPGAGAGGEAAGGSELLEIMPGDYKYGWSAVPRRYLPPDLNRTSLHSHPISSPSTPSFNRPVNSRPSSQRTSLEQHSHPHSPNGQRFRPTDSVTTVAASPVVGSAPTFGSGGGGGSFITRGVPRGRSSMDQHRPTSAWHKPSKDGAAQVTNAMALSPALAVAAMLPSSGSAASPMGVGVTGPGAATSQHQQHHHPQSAPHRTYVISADGSRIRKVPKNNANRNKSQPQQQPQQHAQRPTLQETSSVGPAGWSASGNGVAGGGAVSALSAALAAASVGQRSNSRAATAAAADAVGGGRSNHTGRQGGQGEELKGTNGGAGGINRRRSTEMQNGGWRTGAGGPAQGHPTMNGFAASGAHLGRRQYGGHHHHHHPGQQAQNSVAPGPSSPQPQQPLTGPAAAAAAPIWIGKAGSPAGGGGGSGGRVGKAKVGSPANGGVGGGVRVRSARGAASAAATVAAGRDVRHSASGEPLTWAPVGSRSHSTASSGSGNESGRKGRTSNVGCVDKSVPAGKEGAEQQQQEQVGRRSQQGAVDQIVGTPTGATEARKPAAGVVSQGTVCGGGGGARGLRADALEFKPQRLVVASTSTDRSPAVAGTVEGLIAVAGASM